MTRAAEDLHMTQSGISQHVQSLEEVLGKPLFDRAGRILMPTASARELQSVCDELLGRLESALGEVSGKSQGIRGVIRVGMPVEFGNNVILPRLCAFGELHPNVRFEIAYEYASRINEMLLAGRLDFAFVDEFAMDRRIRVTPLFSETLELCASAAYLKKKKRPNTREDRAFFRGLEYVDYQEGEPILRGWFRHHFGDSRIPDAIRATVFDVQGISRLIQEGLGAGILPTHAIARFEGKGAAKLHVFRGKGTSFVNRIRLAELSGKTRSRAENELRDFLSKDTESGRRRSAEAIP